MPIIQQKQNKSNKKLSLRQIFEGKNGKGNKSLVPRVFFLQARPPQKIALPRYEPLFQLKTPITIPWGGGILIFLFVL